MGRCFAPEHPTWLIRTLVVGAEVLAPNLLIFFFFGVGRKLAEMATLVLIPNPFLAANEDIKEADPVKPFFSKQ